MSPSYESLRAELDEIVEQYRAPVSRDGSKDRLTLEKALEAAMCTPVSRTLCSNIGAALSMGISVLAAMSTAALAADPQGVWLTQDKDAVLTITHCGGQLCGRIIWLESATDRSGSRRLDENNPDPAKRRQRICGLVVIRGLQPSGPNKWDGYVYNPQDGKTYSGNITVLSDNALRLRAYIGLPIFGKSQTWTRVDRSAVNGIEYHCRSPG
jgi:uncharacterized protein (DUF2147 family)